MLTIGPTEHVFCVFGDSRVVYSIDGHTPRDVLVITGFQDHDDWHYRSEVAVEGGRTAFNVGEVISLTTAFSLSICKIAHAAVAAGGVCCWL